MTTKKQDIQLPPGLQPIGLSEYEAAKLYGLSPSAFVELDPQYKPRARRAGGRKVYSRIELEAKFHQLPFWDGDSALDHDGWGVN